MLVRLVRPTWLPPCWWWWLIPPCWWWLIVPDPKGEGRGEAPRLIGAPGDDAREVGREVTGDSVVVVRVRSGCDTELTQQRLDSLDSLRAGRWG